MQFYQFGVCRTLQFPNVSWPAQRKATYRGSLMMDGRESVGDLRLSPLEWLSVDPSNVSGDVRLRCFSSDISGSDRRVDLSLHDRACGRAEHRLTPHRGHSGRGARRSRRHDYRDGGRP